MYTNHMEIYGQSDMYDLQSNIAQTLEFIELSLNGSKLQNSKKYQKHSDVKTWIT